MTDDKNNGAQPRYLPLKEAARMVDPHRSESALKLALQQGRIASLNNVAGYGRKVGSRWQVDTRDPLFRRWVAAAAKLRTQDEDRAAQQERNKELLDETAALRAELSRVRRENAELRNYELDHWKLEQSERHCEDLKSVLSYVLHRIEDKLDEPPVPERIRRRGAFTVAPSLNKARRKR